MRRVGEILLGVVILILLAVYVASPVDLVPGPIDDVVGICMIGGETFNLIRKH